MPFTPNRFAPDRVNFSGLLTELEISDLAGMAALQILQFGSPVHPDNWQLLERGLFSRRPDVGLRAYAHYSLDCDISFVNQMPSLRHFSADCLREASGLQALDDLPNLRHLSISIYKLDNFNFLSSISKGLKTLTLGPTLSTKPDLSMLSRFQEIEKIFVGGHLKGLSTLGSLRTLERIQFSGLKSPDLDFLSKIPNLWSLEILLGGGEDFSAIAGAKGLKHLEITWVRRLKNISFISECENLQMLTLDRLRQVDLLPDLRRLEKLKRLAVTGLKGLKNVDEIGAASALETLTGNAGQLEPEQYRVALQAPFLKRATIYFRSQKKQKEFANIAAQYGVETEPRWEKFSFS